MHSWVGRELYTLTADSPVARGKHTIRYDFDYAGGPDEPGSGGLGRISIDGKVGAEGRIEKTTPFLFSADETADVGVEDVTPVTDAYAERHNEFNGKIASVTVELAPVTGGKPIEASGQK